MDTLNRSDLQRIGPALADKPSEHARVTADLVIMSIMQGELCVFLKAREKEPFAGHWSLPAQTVSVHTNLDDSAALLAREVSGIGNIYLEQLQTFGDPARDPRGRAIAVAYLCLAATDAVEHQQHFSDDTSWFAVDRCPTLAFDHNEILRVGQERLRAKIRYSTIALQLMPAQFTLRQLQESYEAIGGEALDKRNFRKQIRAMNCIDATGKQVTAGSGRPAMLYRANAPDTVAVLK